VQSRASTNRASAEIMSCSSASAWMACAADSAASARKRTARWLPSAPAEGRCNLSSRCDFYHSGTGSRPFPETMNTYPLERSGFVTNSMTAFATSDAVGGEAIP
jgi:hypothetical protein